FSRKTSSCAYARELCGNDLYQKIQASKRAAQERHRANEQQKEELVTISTSENSPTHSSNIKLQILDENTLLRLVAARLDLPVTQRLLTRYRLSIIKRCYEDQLRLKRADFTSDCDLCLACIILQKQIEHIDSKKENIIIPSKKLQEKKLLEERANFQESRDTRNEREKSFLHWPTEKPSIRDMVESGWKRFNSECSVECIYCRQQCHDLSGYDDPFERHQRLSPDCLYVRSKLMGNVRNGSSSIYNIDKLPKQQVSYNGVVKVCAATDYCNFPKRQASFCNYPNGQLNDVDELAANGFYYTGKEVKCFYCNATLNNGNCDNPAIEHLRLNPSCQYAQQYCDEDPTPLLNSCASVISADAQSLCIWCRQNEQTLFCYPCKHLCLCSSCGTLAGTCPICKVEIEYLVKIFPC
ncbi:unnamed protein product, partial [Didymodactylos carnosus]